MRKTGGDYLKIIIIILSAILIVAYFIFNFRIFIAGPDVIVTSPLPGDVVQSDLITIEGKARNVNFISINDRPILVNEEGQFREFLLLSSGYNIISIKARDKFEREISKKIEVTFEGEGIEHDDIIKIESELSTSTDSGTSTIGENANENGAENNSGESNNTSENVEGESDETSQ